MTNAERKRHVANLLMYREVRQALKVKKKPFALGFSLPIKGEKIA